MDKINYSKLPDSTKKLLQDIESRSPNNQQANALTNIATALGNLTKESANNKLDSMTNIRQFGVMLDDIRGKLTDIASKETAEFPDVSTPIVDAIHKLSVTIQDTPDTDDYSDITKSISDLKQTLVNTLKSINFSPNVTSPNVNVSVDTDKMARVLSSTIPKAFNDAIAKIPIAKIPESKDYGPRLDQVIEQLQSIDVGTRMKPQAPKQLAVTNPDGSLVGGASSTQYIEGSTTSPATGMLVEGRYMNTPPVLTDGQIYGSQLNQSGYIRTEIASTNFLFTSGNTTTAQLAAGATFTGAIEAIPYQQTISTIMTSDQNGTLILKQYIDAAGVSQISSWSFPIIAGVPFSRSFTANGNYFRLTFQNTGGSTTTTLSINTAYGTLFPATNLGNVPVSNNEINGVALASGYGSVDAGTQRVVAPNTLVVTGGSLSAPVINTELLTNTVSGWYDASSFKSVNVQIQTGVGISAGVLTFEQTNDTSVSSAGSLWLVRNEASATTASLSAITLAASTTLTYSASVTAKYVRIRVSTAVVGGTVQATANFSQQIWSNPSVSVQGLGIVAMADAVANPSIPVISSYGSLFNGTTWDRTRGMSTSLTIADTGAKTVTFNGATVTNVGNKGVQVVINMGAVTGTVAPTLVAKIQGSVDAGTNWYDIPTANTASITATGIYGLLVYPGAPAVAGTTTTGTTASINGVLPRTWRMVYTIGGTSPSFTITSVTYMYLNN